MPRYNPDGSRIRECENCLCYTCEYYFNHVYDAKKCRFRKIACSICKGRYPRMFCEDYKRCEEVIRERNKGVKK